MPNPEEYYHRTLRLKPLIETDTDLLARIAKSFQAVYDNRMSPYGPIHIPQGLLQLGHGTNYSVVGLGKSITDPLTQRIIPLALKLKMRRPYGEVGYDELEEKLGAYEYAFKIENNPPYFVGVVTANASYDGRPKKRLAGILTEDISNGKTLQLIEPLDDEYCTRILPNGTTEKIFIDPNFFDYSVGGEKYTLDRARIDFE